MRVYEAKLVYSLVSLGEEIRLDRPEKIADYLRSAFEEIDIELMDHVIGGHRFGPPAA